MRTVHSVINYSPPELLYEVVMVDDGSTRDYIAHGAIGEYIKRFNGIVKLYHNEKREGLIRARTIGAKHAQASGRVSADFLKFSFPCRSGPDRPGKRMAT